MTLLLNKFCCCCTTRTGTLVIGTLGWILTLLQIFIGVSQQASQNEHSYGSRDSGSESFHENIYFKVGYGLISMKVCILLFVGVYKQNRRYILPWLVLKGLEATLLIILTGVLFCVACSQGEGVLFKYFFVLLLFTVLQWYFWLCVFSHYKELGESVYSSGNTDTPLYVEKDYNIA